MVSTESVTVSGTGSSGAPFQPRIARMKLGLGWSGRAADLVLLESHRWPVPPVSIETVEVQITDPAGGVAATQVNLLVGGVASGTSLTIAAGASSGSVSPSGLDLPSGGLVSISLTPGTRGNHTTGLVIVTMRYL